MYDIHARPVRDLRNNYSELARMVKEHQHIIVTNNGKSETVLMSIDDYNLCRDFLHTQYVLKELKLAEAEAERTNERLTHEEVFGKFRRKYGYGV
ncbi:MAG: type II toxin-antitoxin system Phd/YefM family antitoxin [Oscillospiraceae bacterium]|nr:type II toxin-antitoxin system Phd/YefM family antitoxin [Oscillospiraceae bacterium]